MPYTPTEMTEADKIWRTFPHHDFHPSRVIVETITKNVRKIVIPNRQDIFWPKWGPDVIRLGLTVESQRTVEYGNALRNIDQI